MVLVHRSAYCSALSSGQKRAGSQKGYHLCSIFKALTFLHLSYSGLIAYAFKKRRVNLSWMTRTPAFPTMVKSYYAYWFTRVTGRWTARGPDVFGGLSIMPAAPCFYGYLPETLSRYHREAIGQSGKNSNRHRRVIGHGLDPHDGSYPGSLYDYLQSVQSYLAPPIAAVFFFGVFFKRLNAKGAYASMVAGFIIGILKLTLQLFKDNFSPDNILYKFLDQFPLLLYLLIFSEYFNSGSREPCFTGSKRRTDKRTDIFYYSLYRWGCKPGKLEYCRCYIVFDRSGIILSIFVYFSVGSRRMIWSHKWIKRCDTDISHLFIFSTCRIFIIWPLRHPNWWHWRMLRDNLLFCFDNADNMHVPKHLRQDWSAFGFSMSINGLSWLGVEEMNNLPSAPFWKPGPIRFSKSGHARFG